MDAAKIMVGGASGYWGDATLATARLLASVRLDYLVYDYLAEITMSILARARAADANKGYAADFVTSAIKPNLREIARQGVKVISNAGGLNPAGCAAALRAIIAEQGLSLKVAVIGGDDLMQRAAEFSGTLEMFSGELFPAPDSIASINAYLGAFPIAMALDRGADIVITGRCVDSAVTLGACIHAFGWGRSDYDKLAGGSLAGHILECGTQATGGNFTDWEAVALDLDEAGYPVAEIYGDGHFVVTKPPGTAGLVSVGTIAEQMLYEIGDPQDYILPDVVCDFSQVRIEQVGTDRVCVTGARGRGAPDSYKLSVTWSDGFRAGQIWTMYGRDAARKADFFARSVIRRTDSELQAKGLATLSETCVEIIGADSQFGAKGVDPDAREVDLKIAARHPDAAGINVFIKEMTGMALTAPPGLTGFAGARAKPSPVVRLHSMTLHKSAVKIHLELEDAFLDVDQPMGGHVAPVSPHSPPTVVGDMTIELPLESLAFVRSGDKGNKSNIGVAPRDPAFAPFIGAALTAERVAHCFAHFLGERGVVERFYLPGTQAFNFVLHDALGGGGIASLRSDPQGKGYSQILLAEMIPVTPAVAARHTLKQLPHHASALPGAGVTAGDEFL